MNRPAGRWYRPRAVWWVVSLLALGGVFVSYLRPDLMLDLANLVWSCF